MNNEEIQELLIRGERTAFLMGTMMGSLSVLSDQILNTEIGRLEIHDCLREIFKKSSKIIDEIYYKNQERNKDDPQ
ncbi:TPA: hypothetical protein ACPSKZ_000703 [Legionella anisa]|uniref:hypothetical protein n=1 Tax=Legionella anisa TaxID=28082 RepID=UPI002244CAFA|nr:hypothetical protein [Legionella anisa]MCW8425599.1 hypothetical protein [Legionella anisa]MCW8448971.1 hypothetical protein [Legionella anisa]